MLSRRLRIKMAMQAADNLTWIHALSRLSLRQLVGRVVDRLAIEERLARVRAKAREPHDEPRR